MHWKIYLYICCFLFWKWTKGQSFCLFWDSVLNWRGVDLRTVDWTVEVPFFFFFLSSERRETELTEWNVGWVWVWQLDLYYYIMILFPFAPSCIVAAAAEKAEPPPYIHTYKYTTSLFHIYLKKCKQQQQRSTFSLFLPFIIQEDKKVSLNLKIQMRESGSLWQAYCPMISWTDWLKWLAVWRNAANRRVGFLFEGGVTAMSSASQFVSCHYQSKGFGLKITLST